MTSLKIDPFKMNRKILSGLKIFGTQEMTIKLLLVVSSLHSYTGPRVLSRLGDFNLSTALDELSRSSPS
jgi:hypothetical protein